MVADEARLLFQKQRALGQAFASAAFEENYLGLLLSQRAFDEGPGGDSPYGGNQVNKMRGNCQFFKEEPRAPKAALSFERFRFWEKINHLRIQSLTDSRTLTRDEKAAVYQEAIKREGLSYSDVRSMLGLTDEERFNSLTYTAKKGMQAEWAALALPERNKQIEEKKVGQFKAWHTLRKALDKADKNKINDLDDITLDAITEILTLYKQDDSILENLKALDLSPEIAESLMNVTPFSGFAHLSVKACRVLLPHLETGMNYDAACTAAGLDFRGHESKPQLTLPAETDDMEQITSPVVRRAVSQTIKVVNAIVRMMGNSPVFVKVELAREMAKNFDERREMKQGMEENAERNERIMERLRQEFHVMNPTGLDLVKLKLYEEQQCKCAYTLEPFDIRRLFEKGYAEIDHIIPYSISFDDSYDNKALVHAKANRDKGNRLPLQYLAGEARERYIVYTANAPYRARKRLNLLKKEITQEDERQFKERNLQDTKHMSRFIYNYMNDYLRFEPFLSGRKKHVTAVSGSITSHLRKRWGLRKDRADGDTHHAQDAAVIACTTDGMIAEISRFYQREMAVYVVEAQGTHSVHRITGERFPLPWPGFRYDVTLRLEAKEPGKRLMDLQGTGHLLSYETLPVELLRGAKPLFVSRMPKRKVSGPAHMDTVKGKATGQSGVYVKRVPLTSLSLADGEIKDYYLPEKDPALYGAMKERLIQHGGDAKKAFAEPLCKPGTISPVRKVKVMDTGTLTIPVHGGRGFAENDSMVRIDIFHVSGEGYYLIPIYVADTIKPDEQWKPMKEEDFLFSLYPSDVILIKDSSPLKLKKTNKDSKLPAEREAGRDELLYYNGCDINGAKINGCSHDNAYQFRKCIKSLQSIEKYCVGILGGTSRVNKEKRLAFHKKV